MKNLDYIASLDVAIGWMLNKNIYIYSAYWYAVSPKTL